MNNTDDGDSGYRQEPVTALHAQQNTHQNSGSSARLGHLGFDCLHYEHR